LKPLWLRSLFLHGWKLWVLDPLACECHFHWLNCHWNQDGRDLKSRHFIELDWLRLLLLHQLNFWRMNVSPDASNLNPLLSNQDHNCVESAKMLPQKCRCLVFIDERKGETERFAIERFDKQEKDRMNWLRVIDIFMNILTEQHRLHIIVWITETAQQFRILWNLGI
jgi:hypothetical protein